MRTLLNSDPGVSGLITPFCETNGLFFNDKNEPESFSDEFKKDVFDYRKNTSTGNNVFISVDVNKMNELRSFIDNCKEKTEFKDELNKSNKKLYIRYLKNFEEEEEGEK